MNRTLTKRRGAPLAAKDTPAEKATEAATGPAADAAPVDLLAANARLVAQLAETEALAAAQATDLRAEIERLTAQNADLRAEHSADVERIYAKFDAERDSAVAHWRERETEMREGYERLRKGLSAGPGRTRPVFDASVSHADPDGLRVTYSPGDAVPDHIDPASLPAGAVKHIPMEG